MRRWTIVLISPQESGNVGGVARVARNFGVASLRIVAPRCEVHNAESRRFSAGAADLLRGAEIFESMEEALADRELSIGLTGVSGKHHKLDCVGLIPRGMLDGKSHVVRGALVFGREDRGMEGPELDRCDYLWSLPTDGCFPSLNLVQAVGIALASVAEAERQLGLGDLGIGLAPSDAALNPLAGSTAAEDQPATNDDLNRLADFMGELMHRTGWPDDRRTRNSIARIRNVLVRGNVTRREVALFLGLCRNSTTTLDRKCIDKGTVRRD